MNYQILLILVLLLAFIQAGSTTQMVFAETKSYTIASGSMEPTLNVNDVVIADIDFPFADIQKDDIIVFKSADGSDRTIVNRVVAIETDIDGNRIITAKGDANPEPRPGTDFPITDKLYIGKVVNVIPGIGIIKNIISPPINYIIGAAIIGGIVYAVHRSRKGKKGLAKPES